MGGENKHGSSLEENILKLGSHVSTEIFKYKLITKDDQTHNKIASMIESQ